MEIVVSNCPICDKTFPDPDDWNFPHEHMMTHTDKERIEADLKLREVKEAKK
jgi:hypothetical protein